MRVPGTHQAEEKCLNLRVTGEAVELPVEMVEFS